MTRFADVPAIAMHIEREIGPVHIVFHEKESDELHVDVHHVKSTFFRRYEVLVTSGMSAVPMRVPEGEEYPSHAEIVALLPRGWPLTMEAFSDERNYWPVRLVKDLARYPVWHNTWLGYGHTVANADEDGQLQPYSQGTRLCAVAIVPSLTLSDTSWCLKRNGQAPIHFWTAVPLYQSELEFKMANGIDALLDLFDKKGIGDRIDPTRDPAI